MDASHQKNLNYFAALYALKGSNVVRISVGGAGDQAAKIDKSKKLAQVVLKRI